MKTKGTADDWFAEIDGWRDEVAALREVVLAAGLQETLKWGQPAYTDAAKNIGLISARTDGAVFSFFKGALLDDPDGLLVSPGENSRHVRYLLFSSVGAVVAGRGALERFLAAAVAAERAGMRVAPPPTDIVYVEELERRLAGDPVFRAAFEGLTPGRRRAYNMHFGQPKKTATRDARISRCTERVLMGKGLNDCVCGHTHRPPGCDGSHKTSR